MSLLLGGILGAVVLAVGVLLWKKITAKIDTIKL